MSKYRSCHSIEGENFFNHLNKVGYCCMTTHCGGQPVLYRSYHGEKIDWEEFLKNREQHIELMKNGGCLKECENCTWIAEKDWKERKRAFNYILLNIWVKCNLFCIYCKNHDNGKPSEVELNTQEYNIIPVLQDMFERGMIDENTKFDIAGGEASLDKNFNALLDLLLEKGIKNININSNCTIYSPSIEKGIEKGIISVTTSIDCGTRNLFKFIKKADLWNTVWNVINKYTKGLSKKNNNYVKTKFIVIPGVNDSKKQIFKYVLMSKLHKVSGVILNIDMHWLSENENDEKKLLNIINLAKYFIQISKKIKINYKVWYHIEDLIKRYNNNFPDKKIDIDFIYKEPEIEPEKYDNLFLNYCKFINKFWI